MTKHGDELVPKRDADTRAELESSQNDAFEGSLYSQSCDVLACQEAPLQRAGTTVLLLGTIILFALALLWMAGGNGVALLQFIPLLVGVLLLHEFGHYTAMRLFGYRDLRIFFVPFFGAIASGKKHAAASWQQAVVLLAGPLPGIAIGVLLLVNGAEGLLGFAAYLLILVNGFNLLPVMPLDGGKLLHQLVFGRSPWLEGLFLAFSGVGMVWLGWSQSSWVLGGIGLLVLVGGPIQLMEQQRRFQLRNKLVSLPTRIESLSEDQCHHLFRCMRSLHPDATDPKECANGMKSLHEEAVFSPPRAWPLAALLSLYVAGCVLTLWTMSVFFYWGDGDHPGEWGTRRIRTILTQELSLEDLTLEEIAPGDYQASGMSGDQKTWTIQIRQNENQRSLKWTAECDDGSTRNGYLYATESGLIIDHTPR